MGQVTSDSLFMAISHRWCGLGRAYPKRVDHFLYICATRPEFILNALERFSTSFSSCFSIKNKNNHIFSCHGALDIFCCTKVQGKDHACLITYELRKVHISLIPSNDSLFGLVFPHLYEHHHSTQNNTAWLTSLSLFPLRVVVLQLRSNHVSNERYQDLNGGKTRTEVFAFHAAVLV